MQNGHPSIMPAPGMPDGMAPLRMKMPQVPKLPGGLTEEEFSKLPPEQ